MDQDLEIGWYTSQLLDSSARLEDSCLEFVRRNEPIFEMNSAVKVRISILAVAIVQWFLQRNEIILGICRKVNGKTNTVKLKMLEKKKVVAETWWLP